MFRRDDNIEPIHYDRSMPGRIAVFLLAFVFVMSVMSEVTFAGNRKHSGFSKRGSGISQSSRGFHKAGYGKRRHGKQFRQHVRIKRINPRLARKNRLRRGERSSGVILGGNGRRHVRRSLRKRGMGSHSRRHERRSHVVRNRHHHHRNVGGGLQRLHRAYHRGTLVIRVYDGVGANESCPAEHNCGHRVYPDGSGPRIITLGAVQQGTAKSSGPLVIRYDESAD